MSGNPVYTPNADFNGTDTFTYTVDDGNGGTDTATVTVTVGAVNDAPVAADDAVGTDEDTPVTIDVLPNDSDPDGDTLSVLSVTQGTNGSVVIDPVSGNPVYTPNPDFNGTDTFTYTVDDGNGGTDTATVTVTVGAVNDVPVAADDAVGTDEDTPVTVDVLPNDNDPDGDTLSVLTVTQGTNGSVAIDPVSGNPVYTPNPDFNGTDTFTYTVDDGNGGVDTATVTVTVGAVNDAPVATDDSVGTDEDTPVTVDVLPNDSDPDGDTLSVLSVTQGANGSVAIDPISGNPVYTPNPDFNGTDTFTYTVDDGNGGVDTATVTVTVGAVNDAPVATDDSVGTDEDTPVTVDVLPNDSDPDGDTLSVLSVTQGSNGSVAIDPVSGNPVYTPNPDFNGTDTFTYTVDDGNGGTDTATVTVTVGAVNDAPVATDDSVGTDEDTPVTVDVLPNDSDPDGDTLSVLSVTQGTNGSVAIDPVSGNPVYTPNSDFNGTDTFTYTVDDGNGGTDTATVTVTVGAVNDAPVATDDSVGTDEDTPVTVDVLPNDSDPDGDTLSVLSVTQGTNGSVAIDPVSGNPVYTPNPDFNGTDTFTYTVDDGNGGVDTATVTVTVGAVNDAPVATDDTIGTDEDTPVTVDVLPNDSDPDGDTLSVLSVTQGTNGSVAIDPVSGNPVYTPNPDFNGTDTFTYTVDDGNGGTDTATVTVTVGAVNDAPEATDDTIGTDEDTPVTVDVLPNDSDPDGDTLSVLSVTQGTNGSVGIDPVSGNPVYTPNPDFNGTDTFTYTVDDGNGGTDTATVTVTVGAVNDAPVAADDSIGTSEDTPVTIDVLPNDTDPDGDILSIAAFTQGTNGTVSIDPVSGNPVYTPNADFNGTDTFTYTVDDGNGGTDTATVTVTVGAVNDAPVAADDAIGTDEDTPVTVDVLPNDSDPDGDALSVLSVTQGTNGSVVIDPVSGNPVYTPNPDFNGTDTFTYTIDDGNGGTDTATVTVTVAAVNDAPVAADDAVGTDEDAPVTVDVLPNDSDPDGDTLSVLSVTQGSNGSVAIDPVSGNPIYTPDPDFNGTDSFTYTVDDGNGGTDTATVTVTVGAVNDAPVAADDSVGTDEDTPVTVDVLPNDSDPDGDTLSVLSVTQGTNGSVAIDPVSGNPVYTPNPDFNGTDTFTYTVDDGNGGVDTATVTVTVGAVNDAPVATDDSIGTDEDTPVTVDVLPNDSDPDGDTLSVLSVTQGTNGTVSIDPVSGNPVYTPNPDFNGTDTFTYTVDDGNGGTDTATVTVTVGAVNDAPVAADDAVGTDEDTPVTVDVLPNDSDPDGDTLSIASFTQGANGTVSIDPVSGNPVYTPNADFNGTDTFTYTVDDGNGGTDTATVTVTVGAVNDAPIAADDTIGTDEDTPVTVDVLPNDSDPDGDTLSVLSVTQGANGSVVIDPVSGNPVYTPNPDFNGTDTFTYTVDDGNGGTDTATVTVTVSAVNDAPVASDDSVDTDEDVAVTVEVLTNDNDPDGDSLSITSFTQGENGSVDLDPVTGNPVYTPNPDFNGTDTFTYTIDDGNGGSDTATVTVTVNAVNDLPEITPATAVVSEEGLVNGVPDSSGLPSDNTDSVNDSGTMSVTDLDEDALTVTLTEPGFLMTSYGNPVTWVGDGTDTLIGSAGGSEVIRISIDQTGNYSVALSNRVDHPVVGQEDVLSFDVDVTVNDGTESVSAPLTIQIEDDAPSVNSVTANIHVGVDSLSIQNLAAGWTNPVFIDGTRYVTQQDTDSDSYTDNLLWGRVPRGGSQSGYTLVDNSAYTGSGQSVQIGETFKLADFSHNNFPIYSGSSTLDQVTLTIEMDVVVNGIPTTVQFDVLMDHNETPNDGADPRDIITLPTQAVTISIGGQEYEVRVDGFRDSSGQIVSTILTDENAVNPFEIMGSIVSTDPLPVVNGSVSNATGGDGSSTVVVWEDTSSPYGDLTVNSNGDYSFQLNRETKDGLDPGETITESFAYSITDEDGDVSSATLTITIGGYESIDGSALADVLRGSNADEYLAGYEGNDSLDGRGGDDLLDGGAGSDDLSGGRGNDTLIFDSADSSISGDAGFDTLIAPDNDDLDFSSISSISNIERIDLTVGDHDILNLSVDDVLTMTDNDNLLEILGDNSDSVALTNDWHASGNTVTQNGHTFSEYLNADDSVTLLIEDQVNVTIV
ncbi:MAG: Ig-like domain-containing protein [Candidatus Thiodiazotropha sp.]